MKKIVFFIITVFMLIGCTNTNNNTNNRDSQYSTGALILDSIIATALYNNHGVSVGESKVKTKRSSNMDKNTSTTVLDDGSVSTHTVTKTTTKSKSKEISYGIGF